MLSRAPVAALLVLAMCKSPAGPLAPHVHPTTHLSLLVPATVHVGQSDFPLAVTESPAGFRVATTAFLRNEVALTADVEPGSGAPAGPWPSERRFDERVVRYRVDESSEGMGGDGYALVAWEACSGGRVVYRQAETVEAPARPDFSLAWTVIEHARVP